MEHSLYPGHSIKKRTAERAVRLLLTAVLLVSALKPLKAEAAGNYYSIFDAKFYASKYPDLAAAFGTNFSRLYNHYATIGVIEGRQPGPRFNPVYYKVNYPELAAAYGNNWQAYAQHYITTGRAEGRVAGYLLSEGKPEDYVEETGPNVIATPVAPNPAGYMTTTDQQDVQNVIDSAQPFLNGRNLAYHQAVVVPGSRMMTYYDGSIFCVGWKERRGAHLCTFTEVIVADGSQFRRKISDDTFGSRNYRFASQLAAQAGAVVASTSDFYMFRGVGTVVHDGVLYRFTPGLDTCYVTYDGDMLFSYAYQLNTREECEAFIAQNNVNFAMTFGPVIIDDGMARKISSYQLGEINGTYSRGSVGMLEPKHYLLMTMNYEYGGTGATLQAEIDAMSAYGCLKAYALDGGGTCEIMFGNTMYNRPDHNKERAVSDIIYFASYPLAQ